MKTGGVYGSKEAVHSSRLDRGVSFFSGASTVGAQEPPQAFLLFSSSTKSAFYPPSKTCMWEASVITAIFCALEEVSTLSSFDTVGCGSGFLEGYVDVWNRTGLLKLYREWESHRELAIMRMLTQKLWEGAWDSVFPIKSQPMPMWLDCGSYFFIFYWSIIDQPCHDRFRYTPRWFSYKYIHIGSFFKFFSHLVITEYWAVFSVLYSRSLLVIYFKIEVCPLTEKMLSLQAVQICAMALQPTSGSLLQCCCTYTTGCASTPSGLFASSSSMKSLQSSCAIIKQHLWFQSLFMVWHWDVWSMWPVVAGDHVRLANWVHVEAVHSRDRRRQHLLWQSPWTPARFLCGVRKRPSSRRCRKKWNCYLNEQFQPRDGRLACARDGGRGHLTPGGQASVSAPCVLSVICSTFPPSEEMKGACLKGALGTASLFSRVLSLF